MQLSAGLNHTHEPSLIHNLPFGFLSLGGIESFATPDPIYSVLTYMPVCSPQQSSDER